MTSDCLSSLYSSRLLFNTPDRYHVEHLPPTSHTQSNLYCMIVQGMFFGLPTTYLRHPPLGLSTRLLSLSFGQSILGKSLTNRTLSSHSFVWDRNLYAASVYPSMAHSTFRPSLCGAYVEIRCMQHFIQYRAPHSRSSRRNLSLT